MAELAFAMPSLGADMLRGRVIAWRVKPGDQVRRGQVIVEVETDKGLIDVECFHEGTVLALLEQEGAEVAVGAVIARLEVSDAAAALAPSPPAAPTPAAPTAAAPASAAATPFMPTQPEPAAIHPPRPSPGPPPTAGARIVASPLARRRAAELGVDLAAVAPGLDGRIASEDVERAAAARSAPSQVAPRDASQSMRRAIAANAARSKSEIPHYYLWQSVDITDALARLRAHNQERSVNDRVLFAAVLARAVARAAAAAPELNGTFVDGALRSSAAVHLGFATAQRGGGLIAPAILEAHTRSLDDMMKAIGDLVQRVRSGGLRGAEMTAGTITLTSLGDTGVDGLLPVIQWPQVAIVGAGRAVERPWVVDGVVAVRSIMTLSLAADHRASDGHRGARFLQAIEKQLCSPETP